MQEFAAISVSTYDPDSLVAQLNERSADGWAVVSIVPTGSTVTAYLSRAASGDADDATADVTPAPVTPEPGADEPAAGGDGWAASTAAAAAITPQPANEPTVPSSAPDPTPAVAPAAEPTGSSAAAPAGWYADPSSRYELRYWDGSTWTEHVSRGGQQFTDPPVA